MVDAKGMELKPCPFCGGEAILEEIGQGKVTLFKVQCKTNHCTEHYGWRSNRQKTIENWNRRYEPPNEPLTLEELRGMDFGNWVWIKSLILNPEADILTGYYCKMDRYRPEDAFYFGYPGYDKVGYSPYGQYADYGKTWLAYRHKPEEV